MKLERVETMPTEIHHGILYFSAKYDLAMHLCPCSKCVDRPHARALTQLAPGWSNGWTLTIADDKPTLSPSILNTWCRAHYFIRDGEVVWA